MVLPIPNSPTATTVLPTARASFTAPRPTAMAALVSPAVIAGPSRNDAVPCGHALALTVWMPLAARVCPQSSVVQSTPTSVRRRAMPDDAHSTQLAAWPRAIALNTEAVT